MYTAKEMNPADLVEKGFSSMKVDVGFYLNGSIEERLYQLITPESPLKLEKESIDFYILRSKDPVLKSFFVYGTPDYEIISKNPLHIEAQKTLDFHPGSLLYYDKCNLCLEKISSFRKITEYIVAKNISFYLSARNEYGEEIILGGYNPITNTEIQKITSKPSKI